MHFKPLLKRYFGREISPTSISPMKGDASSRQYFRVDLPDQVVPSTMVVMALPPDTSPNDEVTMGDAPSELPFVNVCRHLSNKGLRVPDIYLSAVPDRALLIEDLGDVVLADVASDPASDEMVRWYEAAVDLLVDMHRAMWPIPKRCVAASRCFEVKLLWLELDHYREWGVDAFRETPLSGVIRSELDAAFEALAREIAALPLGFVHRDYQSRNLMVIGDTPIPENLAIIDFQDAMAGPRVYDLVALLNDSYIDIPKQLKGDLLARYAKKMEFDVRALYREFHLVSVQRKLKDGGRFVYIDRVKNNPSFLPFVEGSFGRVRTSLDAIEGWDSLKRALASADPDHFQ
ncbi:MAG: phosphotransferase [Myxococcota bacterium]|nr:phosphotransferase [Myxococcota bacterium]